MLKLWLFPLAAVACFATTPCVAVGPSAGGTGTGASWTNRRNDLPTTLTRGTTYYLMDGTYATYQLTTVDSSTTGIVIKKAQSYDFGRTADGCSNDISAGWSVSTMGASQAQFVGFNADLGIDYITLDGNGQSAGPGCGTSPNLSASVTDCGIKLGPVPLNSIGYVFLGSWNNGATRNNNWTFRYIEGIGGGTANNTSGAQEEDLTCRDGCNNLLWEHSYLHDSGCDYVKIPWSTGAVWRYNFFQKNESSSSSHGQLLLSEVSTNNVDFHNNILEDITGTSIWSSVTGAQNDGWLIYNNVILRPSGSVRPGNSQGIISCVNPGVACTNFKFIGNTIINETDDFEGHYGFMAVDGTLSVTVQNNLFYNTTNIGNGTNGGTLVEDHNSFLNCGVVSPYYTAASDVVVTSGAANPFVSWTSYNFNLAAQDANWSNGVTLASPFNVDAVGSARPGSDGAWDRGAFEFVTAAAAANHIWFGGLRLTGKQTH